MTETPVIRVVDDDQGFRSAIGRLLRTAGYEVREYASAGALLLADEEQTPGCVLLDMKMPGPSGLDLQEALAKRDRKLPIIFLTAYADVRNSVRAMKAGAMDFLAKPVKRDALLATVRAALARDEERRESPEHPPGLRAPLPALSPPEPQGPRPVAARRPHQQNAPATRPPPRTAP